MALWLMYKRNKSFFFYEIKKELNRCHQKNLIIVTFFFPQFSLGSESKRNHCFNGRNRYRHTPNRTNETPKKKTKEEREIGVTASAHSFLLFPFAFLRSFLIFLIVTTGREIWNEKASFFLIFSPSLTRSSFIS